MEKHRNLSYQEQLLEDINRAEQDKFEVPEKLILDLIRSVLHLFVCTPLQAKPVSMWFWREISTVLPFSFRFWVTNINFLKIFTQEKVLWSFIKFSRLILLGNAWRSVWRICMWILWLKGLRLCFLVLPVKTFHSSFKQLATSKLPKASVSKRG